MPGDDRLTDGRSEGEGLIERQEYSESADLMLDAQRPSPSNPPGGEPNPPAPSGENPPDGPSDGPVNQVIEYSESLKFEGDIDSAQEYSSDSDRSYSRSE